jgi:vacuolar-type H+-ATPase subunit I/STV1
MTADDSQLSHKERQLGELRSDIETTREKLAQTLDAIEDRLNVPKQAKQVAGRARETFDRLSTDNPVLLYAAAGVAAVVAVGGVVVWRIVRR